MDPIRRGKKSVLPNVTTVKTHPINMSQKRDAFESNTGPKLSLFGSPVALQYIGSLE